MCPPAGSGRQNSLGRSIDPYSTSFELPYHKGAIAGSLFKQVVIRQIATSATNIMTNFFMRC